jgi:hypothetical protein
VPELQRPGLFRKAFAGPTLRENLGLPVPAPGVWRDVELSLSAAKADRTSTLFRTICAGTANASRRQSVRTFMSRLCGQNIICCVFL